MTQLIKTTYVYNADSEQESTSLIEKYKNEQLEKGYMVTKSKVDYKAKKDRKTGEIISENWLTEVTIAYEV